MTHHSFRLLFRAAVLAFACAALPARAATVYAYYPFDSNYNDAPANNRHGTLADVGTIDNSAVDTGNSKFGGGSVTMI